MVRNSFNDLAAFFPRQLGLGRCAGSRSVELIAQAADNLTWPTDWDPSDLVALGGEYPAILGDQTKAIRELLSQNRESLRAAELALSHSDDFCLVPSSALRRSPATAHAEKLSRNVDNIHDLLSISARVEIREHQLQAAASAIAVLFRMGTMFCSGSGGRDWYFRGICAVRRAQALIREFIKVGSRQNASVLRELMTVLQNHEAIRRGYLHAMLRNYIRGILVALADADGIDWSPDRLAGLLKALIPFGDSGTPFAAAPPSPSCTPSPRVCAVLAVVENNPHPFSAIESAHTLSLAYNEWLLRFSVDMRAGMRVPNSVLGHAAVWPDEFHLSSGSLITPSSATIASAASAVGRLPNALGLLILRDITRIVRVILVDPLLIVPYATPLPENDAAVLTLAIKIFEAEKGANLRSSQNCWTQE